MGDRPPERREDRPGALDLGGVAADEDRERRVAGALAAAGHRRVDERRALLRQPGAEVAGCRGRDRRAVGDEQALAGAIGDAVRTEQH
jgi:hypothetical protein